MSQQIAIIVHHLVDSPESWREDGDYITNGYYRMCLNSTRYGIGASLYSPSGEEKTIMQRALDSWKEETRWKPKIISQDGIHYPSSDYGPEHEKEMSTIETAVKGAYAEFSRTVRSHCKSFQVHGDVQVLTVGLQNAISILDLILRPVEKMEGRGRNAKGDGIPSA